MSSPASTHLSITERLAAGLSASIVAAAALIAAFRLRISPSYPDFIVGSITWRADTKLQDIVAVSVLIVVFSSAALFIARVLAMLKERFGPDCAARTSSQLIWWSVPAVAAMFGLFWGPSVDAKLIAISCASLIFIGTISIVVSRKGYEPQPDAVGLCLLSAVFISLAPIAAAVALGRVGAGILAEGEIRPLVRSAYVVFAVGFGIAFYYIARRPAELHRYLPRVIFGAQILLPLFFLALYPAVLMQPTGELTHYAATAWLKVFVFGMIVLGAYDAVTRYLTYSRTGDWFKLLSPIAVFAPVVVLKVGATVSPIISPDDYHFGENLLGWWSYQQGAIPYLGHTPPHGLIDDYFDQLIASIFYDGTAASIGEARRLSYAILGLIAFSSVYYFSGSIGLAAVSALVLGPRPAWYFITPFLCLWFSSSLRRQPSRWLVAWILSAPLLILGAPSQGLLLIAASSVMAAYMLWLQHRAGQSKSWIGVGIAAGGTVAVMLLTPVGSMLFGAIRYVLENGAINQVAYGIAWDNSWDNGEKRGVVFEAIRMSWVIVALACFAIAYGSRRKWRDTASAFFPAVVCLLFILFLIPYSVGRIDAGVVSRPGLTAMFAWTVVLPVVGWSLLKDKDRAVIPLLVACMGMLLSFVPLSVRGLVSAGLSKISTPLLRDGATVGLPNIGTAHVQDDHWERLMRLNAVLTRELLPGEKYLDLTSRNAQYFYLNRRPAMAVTAPYNMPSGVQQRREVEALKLDLPKLALLQGDNIVYDGGGLALRNPYLYRFVVDNYIPRFDSGFIVGYKRSEAVEDYGQTIVLNVKRIIDTSAARKATGVDVGYIVSDPVSLSFIKAGDLIRLGNGETRPIVAVRRTDNSVWVSGSPHSVSGAGTDTIRVIVDRATVDQYNASLFQRSFSEPEFHKIPVAWGRSERSLLKKMRLVQSIDVDSSVAATEGGQNWIFSFLGAGLSGRDAGLLKFNFTCVKKTAEPRIEVFWWDGGNANGSKYHSVRFTADNGVVIVPLDASPYWLTLKTIGGMKLELSNKTACRTFSFEDVALYQRIV